MMCCCRFLRQPVLTMWRQPYWHSLPPCRHPLCPLLLPKSVMCVCPLQALHHPCWLTPYHQLNGLSSDTSQVSNLPPPPPAPRHPDTRSPPSLTAQGPTVRPFLTPWAPSCHSGGPKHPCCVSSSYSTVPMGTYAIYHVDISPVGLKAWHNLPCGCEVRSGGY